MADITTHGQISIGIDQPIILTSSTPHADIILNGIAYLHAQCIMHDGTMVTFMPPLSYTKILSYWKDFVRDTDSGNKIIVVLLMPIKSRSSEPPDVIFAADSDDVVQPPELLFDLPADPCEVVSVVALDKPISETGPFRGVVQKLFVSPCHRKKGIARRMLRELESQARLCGRWMLTLDTTIGTAAELIYPRLGYTELGRIKAYGLRPKDRTLADEIFFWKDLRHSEPL